MPFFSLFTHFYPLFLYFSFPFQSGVKSLNDSDEHRKSRDADLDKAMSLLRNPDARYDPDHAMVLVRMHEYKPGILYLYEKLKLYVKSIFFGECLCEFDAFWCILCAFLCNFMDFCAFYVHLHFYLFYVFAFLCIFTYIIWYRYKEILQYYIDHNEYSNVLLCCKKYGYAYIDIN